MKLEKIFVGMPREVDHNGKPVSTGIFKTEVRHSVQVRGHNIEGDGQADLRVHGGEYKAIYSYAAEHYDWWRAQPGLEKVTFGDFGENLLIRGMDESKAYIGNVYGIGTVKLEAVQPRFPCFKLGIRFGDATIIKRFMESDRWGVYYRILQEGSFAPGDSVTLVSEHRARIPVAALSGMLQAADPAELKRALQIACLAPEWRRKFQEKLARG